MKHELKFVMKNKSLFLLNCLCFFILPCLHGQNKTLEFSGIAWTVWGSEKNGIQYQNWSDDEKRRLARRSGSIAHEYAKGHGDWLATQVQSKKFLGYGDYRFFVEENVAAFHQNINIGMFTYEYINKTVFREIDIELSRFGQINGPVGNYTIQPYSTPGNYEKFELNFAGKNDYKTTHRFV